MRSRYLPGGFCGFLAESSNSESDPEGDERTLATEQTLIRLRTALLRLCIAEVASNRYATHCLFRRS
jgi:hypothetical protein